MVNLKFGAFIFALCLLLTSCVCETNATNVCTIQDTTATCESNENFKSLGDATNITKLIVRSKELKRINKDDFAAFVNLEEIDLSNSGLEEVDENAFAALTKLHMINFAGNTNLKIPKDASFITSNTLTCLNLSHTIVEELDNTFAHLPQLKNLDLSGTNVKDFSPLTHLEHLSKLVVSKTNETKDLCNILADKEIIEKDANETEIPLDCKDTKINATDSKTEEPSTTVKTPENEVSESTAAKLPEVTTVPAKPEAAQNLTEVTPGAENTPKVTTEAIKLPEVTTASPKTEAPVLPEVTATEKPIVNKDAAKETNKTEDEPKKESSEKDAPPAENTEKDATTEKSVQYKETNEDKSVEKVVSLPHAENEVPDQPNIKNTEKTDVKAERKENKGELKIAATKMKDAAGPSDENPKVILDASEDVILPSTANTSQSNGVNIVLGIILCVMIVGAIGFGYKYWKNRRSGYTHANTHDHDDEDKELQTIVAHRTDPDQN